MNNEQFRKLMLATSAKSSSARDGSPSTPANATGAAVLGTRQRSSIPMTPRSLGGTQADFARQLAERTQASRPQKKFKSSTPRGIRLASGYVDRSREVGQQEVDDRETRLEALEELLKKEDIDQETFDKLRNQIVGGDLGSTHLVKGLDFKLLERIKRGEDVYEEKQAEAQDENESDGDADGELDQLGEQEVVAKAKDMIEKKKGQLSTVSLAPGKKRTRDQILAEWKAAREAAKAQQEPALGDRFRKIGAKQMPGSRIERDSKGREVLIIVDEDGHEKRKVRKLQPGAETAQNELLVPDKDAKPLGLEVPESAPKHEEPEEDLDVDIFEGVGDDYDPLAGMDTSSSESEPEDDDDENEDKATRSKNAQDAEAKGRISPSTAMPPPPKPTNPLARHNYFQDSKTRLISSEDNTAPSMSDEAVMAAIKKASAMKRVEDDSNSDSDEGDDSKDAKQAKALNERRKRLLENRDRDEDDIDMGFGTSRFEDEADLGDEKVKLSVWGDGDDDKGGQKGGAKRKRGPKKRKGDANNAADVLRVMEQRKKS